MPGAKMLILDGLLQGNLDCGGFKLINVDISNLTPPVTFGVVKAHHVFAGPDGGPDAIPTFREMTAVEFDAQPHSDGLDILSPTTPTNLGLALLQIPDTLVAGYPRASGSETPPFASFVTPTQLRTDIQAQPQSAALDLLSPLSISNAGISILQVFSVSGGYPKFGASPGNVCTILTGQQTADDLAPLISPFTDSKPHVKNSAQPTKLFRIDASAIAIGATRVMTPPDYDFAPASIAHAESLINKIINGMTLKVGTAAGGAAEDLISWSQTPPQPMQLGLVDTSGSGAELILRLPGPVDMVVRDGNAITTETNAPDNATDPGVTGQTAYSSTFEYRCVGTNTWRRTPLSAW